MPRTDLQLYHLSDRSVTEMQSCRTMPGSILSRYVRPVNEDIQGPSIPILLQETPLADMTTSGIGTVHIIV